MKKNKEEKIRAERKERMLAYYSALRLKQVGKQKGGKKDA